MGEQEQNFSETGKRKLDVVEMAKQKAQEIASRLLNDADPKRPRLGSENSSEPSFFSNSGSNPPFPVPYASQPSQYSLQGSGKIITIPNGKVGVVIGKGGETIKYIQLQSGAKIQITKDQEADPHSLTRDVELTGTSQQISRAEELINNVIAETDAGGSASSAVLGMNTKQSAGEQFSIKVPNDKVGLLIGKGGETIKYMQSKSGARMQIIPLHLPPGDPTTERTVYINGTPEQIETAKELVNDVINGKRIVPSGPSSYAHQAYPTSGNWAQPGQPPMQQPSQYGYAQPGNYPTPASYYGNYSNQQAGWDQSNPSPTLQQTTGYGYYGQPQMGSAPPNPNYSYSQTPAVSNTYDQGYSQQSLSYGQAMSGQASTQEQQKPYATTGYGATTMPSQPDGGISSQSTQQSSAYPPSAYGQLGANPQTYWNSSYTQTGYDQTAYSQTAYAGMQNYGQSGYGIQQNYAPAYGHGQPQLDTQTPSQPPNNGSQYGAETHDDNQNLGHASNSSAKESDPSQS